MTPANYWKLGLFIVVTLTTGLGLLAFLGAKQIQREVEDVHYFFNQTVDGLSVGSEIRMRGIPIGRVTEVGLAEDRIHVHAKGEIRVATMERLGLRQLGIEASPEEVRERIRESGLRAFLEQNILTGGSTDQQRLLRRICRPVSRVSISNTSANDPDCSVCDQGNLGRYGDHHSSIAE